MRAMQRVGREREGDFIRHDLGGGRNLFSLRTGRFKTIVVKVFLRAPLDGDATRFALAPAVLARGTAALPDMADIARFVEECYGASFHYQVQKVGEIQQVCFQFELVDPRYLHGANGLVDGFFGFIRDVLRDPAREGAGLVRRYVEQEKVNLKKQIEGLVNDKAQYAFQRCLAHMFPGEPYRLYEYGDAEQVDAVDAPGLSAYHAGLLRDAPMDLFIAGDVSESRALRLAAAALAGERGERAAARAKSLINAGPGHRSARVPARPRRVRERLAVKQAQVVLGFRTGVRHGDATLPALQVMNAIYGGLPVSRLFKNIREKRGLCYSVTSWLDASQGVMFAAAGVAPEKAAEVADLMVGDLESLAAGAPTREEMAAARKAFQHRYRSCRDTPGATIDHFQHRRLSGVVASLSESSRRVCAVRPEEVGPAAGRARLDTVYHLVNGRPGIEGG
ncbi:MAG: insulinase family protein [Planctomycetes bacterium]|nr:insulinase family protein [Planctomycetota bacterium]